MANSPDSLEPVIAPPKSSGQGWEVVTGLITPAEAAAAGREAILLNGLYKQSRVAFSRKQPVWDNPARIVMAVDLSALAARGVSRQFSHLLGAYNRVEEEVNSGADNLYLDFHEGGGELKPYAGTIDPEAEETITIGLVGTAGVIIKAPGTDENEAQFELQPAEALRFMGGPGGQSPLKVEWNTSVNTRVDLIVG